MVEGLLGFLRLKRSEGETILLQERKRLAETWRIDSKWKPPTCPDFQNLPEVSQVDIRQLPLGSAVMLEGPSALHRYLVQVELGNNGLRSYHLRMMNDERNQEGVAYEVKTENLGSVQAGNLSRRLGIINRGETLAYPYFAFDKKGLVPWSERSSGQFEWLGSCLKIKVFRPPRQ